MSSTETLILSSLMHNEEYMRKVIPYVRDEYFLNNSDKILFKEVHRFIEKYNDRPTYEALAIAVGNREDLTDEQLTDLTERLDEVNIPSEKQSLQYLLDETEKFCQDRAVYNAIMRSIKIIDGKEDMSKEAIPEILQDALRVSFDLNVGHDFVEDFESRFAFYHNEEQRVSLMLEYFDKITMGGFPKKTLNVFLAGTNVGKTLIMCSLAANALKNNKNVLYITLEMAEEAIAQRVDQNLLNLSLEDLVAVDKAQYMERFQNRVASKTTGKLIIKEYPTAGAHVGHFRHLLKELKLKKRFTPDIVFIDYLGICASSRLKMGGSVNSYSFVKFIAEEIRGLAKEFDIPIVTGAQTNRGGQNEAELSLEDTADSFGLPQTADFLLGISETPQLAELGQFLCVQLKNRYRDKNRNRCFIIGVDKEKQRLHDVSDEAQKIIGGKDAPESQEEDVPVFDNTTFGKKNRNVKRDDWN